MSDTTDLIALARHRLACKDDSLLRDLADELEKLHEEVDRAETAIWGALAALKKLEARLKP